MKISTPSGPLEIPQDLDFEIKASHPFFSDEGSSSIPVTIPATAMNCAILGYPERIDRRTRYERESSAIAECGLWRKQCKVLAESAGRSSGISLCLALAESEMYADIKDRKLKDIFAEGGHVSMKSSSPTPYDAYKAVHITGTEPYGYPFPFALFPIAADLNGVIGVINLPVNETILSTARTITAGDKTLSVPEGYGVAPYMYLWHLIETVFQYCGFNLGANCFKDNPDLCKIVVIHNHADVSVGHCDSRGMYWGFQYADIVPDITLGDLIVWMHDKFGAVIRYDSVVISIYLMRDILTQEPDYDLTPIAINDETLSYPAPSTIERSVDTSIKSAEPAAETLEALREKYPSCTNVSSVDNIVGSGLFYVYPLGKYYYKPADGDAVLLGSSSFSYKRSSALKGESLSTDDCFLPSVIVDGVIMPYVGERTHLYIEDGQEKTEQPLQICYAHDVLLDDGTYVMAGSSFSYDHRGYSVTKRVRNLDGTISLIPHPDLTPEGLSPFWSGYEQILMNSAPEVSLECDFPMADLTAINLVTPKLFRGVRVLIKEITYKVSDTATTRAKLSLQVIPLYDNMEVPATIHFNSSLGWKLVSTRSIFDGDGYTINETDGLVDYDEESSAPSYAPKTSGIITKKRTRWLKYTRKTKTVRWYGVTWSTSTGTHKWEEYFISEATE